MLIHLLAGVAGALKKPREFVFFYFQNFFTYEILNCKIWAIRIQLLINVCL